MTMVSVQFVGRMKFLRSHSSLSKKLPADSVFPDGSYFIGQSAKMLSNLWRVFLRNSPAKYICASIETINHKRETLPQSCERPIIPRKTWAAVTDAAFQKLLSDPGIHAQSRSKLRHVAPGISEQILDSMFAKEILVEMKLLIANL